MMAIKEGILRGTYSSDSDNTLIPVNLGWLRKVDALLKKISKDGHYNDDDDIIDVLKGE